MPDTDLHRVAQEYADLFNRSDPAVIEDVISEACIEPSWDDRTNLMTLRANSPEELGLVLATEQGGEDYVVVRFAGRWMVDDTPVDWDRLEDELLDRHERVWARRHGARAGFGEDDGEF